jgi:hypothetical protein
MLRLFGCVIAAMIITTLDVLFNILMYT